MFSLKPTSILLALVAALQLASIAESHSRLLEPRARNGGFIGAFDNFVSPACGGDGSKNNARPADATYRRGQTVPIVWPRNNHPGGFISLKVVPFNGPQTQADFDRNIIQYACHESGCKSGFAGNPLAGDNMPEDTNRCSTPFTVPTFLADGQYTLQWHWYGGGSFFGDVNRGQTDYYGCHDFTVAGGSAFNAASKPRCPTFIAGDAHNPASSGRCKFFGTGSAFSCRPDGCSGSYKDGIPKALEQCLAANGGGNPTPPPAPAPQPPAPVPQPPTPAPQPQPQPQPNPPSNFENLQRFQGALFNVRAPVVRNVGGSRPFIVQLANGEVNGNFNAVQEALGRSCDVQANLCANRVNGAGGRLEGKSVGDCDGQRNECKALIR